MTSTHMTSVSRLGAVGAARTALLHPVFWAALALLLLNDHVLKGAGLVPAVLTGKLSDFAGLIVAPWLAVAALGALGARSRRARIVAYALVVLPFAATKSSPLAAELLDATMNALGLAWRTWSDPTDLVALVVLPLGWHLSTPRVERASGGAARALERAGLLLGAAACLATSAPPGVPSGIVTTAWVLNRTGTTITLRVHWAEAAIDCAAIEGRGARAATRGVFGEGRSFLVRPNATLALADTLGVTDIRNPGGCEVVLLQADGLDDTVVAWSSLGSQTIPTTLVAGDDGTPFGRVTLVGRGAEILPVAGTDVEVGDLAEFAAPSVCPRALGESAEWSFLDPLAGYTHQIDSIDVGPDGCFGLRLISDVDAATRSFFLCVPDFTLPFAAGTRVTIEDTVDYTGTGRRLRIVDMDGELSARSSLMIFAGVDRLEFYGLTGSIDPADCEGDRQACGALTLPASSTVTYAGVRTTLQAGEAVMFDAPIGDLGVRSRLVYARGERVVFAPSACSPGRTEPRVHGDFVLTTYGSGGTP